MGSEMCIRDSWNSVWRRFDRWCENDVWERIVKELCEYDFEEVQLDSTSIKVHLAAVGGRREGEEKNAMPIVAEVWAALGVT